MKALLATILTLSLSSVFAADPDPAPASVADKILVWKTKVMGFEAQASDTKAETDFHFTNMGDKDLKITRVRASCGCTTAKLEKKIYKPGESGTLHVVFSFYNRKGKQVKTIYVSTDNPEIKNVKLYFQGFIPRAAKISRRLLVWKKDREAESKSTTIKFGGGKKYKILGMAKESKNFTMTVHPEPESELEYRLEFTPKSTAARIKEKISLKVEPPLSPSDEENICVHLYVR